MSLCVTDITTRSIRWFFSKCSKVICKRRIRACWKDDENPINHMHLYSLLCACTSTVLAPMHEGKHRRKQIADSDHSQGEGEKSKANQVYSELNKYDFWFQNIKSNTCLMNKTKWGVFTHLHMCMIYTLKKTHHSICARRKVVGWCGSMSTANIS